MSDETIEHLVERQERLKLKAACDLASERREKDAHRSLDIKTSFYDKLAALGAGSIAVAVSIGIALMSKSELLYGSFNATAAWFTGIVVCFWISLICAVLHNFIATRIAKLEATYSQAKLERIVLRQIDPRGRADDIAWIAQCEKKLMRLEMQYGPRSRTLRLCTNISASISIASFLVAYTVVVVCVVRLWWITR
jgi:hypothetical protein